jgi:predicted RNA-binding Zn-ribbon protein involved in translation (DUF1610 family)
MSRKGFTNSARDIPDRDTRYPPPRWYRARMTLRFVVALILGVATTWLVAAACATFRPSGTVMVSGAAGPTAPTWTFRQWRSFGCVSSNYSPCTEPPMIAAYEGAKPHLVPWWSDMNRTPQPLDYPEAGRGYIWFGESGYGWPLAAFREDTDYDGRVRNAGTYIVARSGTRRWERGNAEWVAPYAPIWLGLAGNVSVYTLLWMLPLAVPSLLRRRRRLKRGLCVGCGYDLKGGGAAVCPECGRRIVTASSSARRPSSLPATQPRS